MVPGFINSTHIFGRSSIMRHANKMFVLKWQWNKHKGPNDLIFINEAQYYAIKYMLLEGTLIESKDAQFQGFYKHKTSPKNYAHIKRYLIKKQILRRIK